jgi:hypothetical protein
MNDKFCFLRRSDSISCEAEVLKDRPSKPIVCPRFPGHRRARRLPGPITIDIEHSDSADCLWTFFSDCLLNDVVIEELLSKGCTGFSTGVVEAKGNATGKTYSQFRAVGWGGFASPLSGIHETSRCDFCGTLKYSGLEHPKQLFNPSRWDGSDVFFIWPLPNFICLSPAATEIFVRFGVTGAELTPVDRLRTSGRGFGPGRLSNWMPKERAIEIGRPLGIE